MLIMSLLITNSAIAKDYQICVTINPIQFQHVSDADLEKMRTYIGLKVEFRGWGGSCFGVSDCPGSTPLCGSRILKVDFASPIYICQNLPSGSGHQEVSIGIVETPPGSPTQRAWCRDFPRQNEASGATDNFTVTPQIYCPSDDCFKEQNFLGRVNILE